MTTDSGTLRPVILEDLIITPQPVEHVPIEDLSAEVRQRWLVEVDLDELIASKNLKILARSEALQLKLAAEYRDHKSKQDKETMDSQAILHWTNLVFVTGSPIWTSFKFHLRQGLFVDCGIALKQRVIAMAVSDFEECRAEVSELVQRRVDLPDHDLSNLLNLDNDKTWKILPTPLPYGPTIDDMGNLVEHYVLWSCHNILDEATWLASELAEVHENGVAGFIGFEAFYGGPPFDNTKLGFSDFEQVWPEALSSNMVY